MSRQVTAHVPHLDVSTALLGLLRGACFVVWGHRRAGRAARTSRWQRYASTVEVSRCPRWPIPRGTRMPAPALWTGCFQRYPRQGTRDLHRPSWNYPHWSGPAPKLGPGAACRL